MSYIRPFLILLLSIFSFFTRDFHFSRYRYFCLLKAIYVGVLSRIAILMVNRKIITGSSKVYDFLKMLFSLSLVQTRNWLINRLFRMGLCGQALAPLIEELFDSISTLWARCGDTAHTRTCKWRSHTWPQDRWCTYYYGKSQQMCNVEYDVSFGYFSKYDPGNLKYQSNRYMALIEVQESMH